MLSFPKSSLRGKTVSFDEAISGVLLHEIAVQPTAARNDD
ncbi:hypothetical protein RFEPED_0447 [Rickettsia felis str. Pedreira]|uniref:Uncharacterized protein n=1 Tax=Rickettsia felis str. Pedreira TaxID=1359196 RepID=A0A0F3MQS5_RICFI|nr:hypothetical protein RFEPED_0447 [Rickettsia felis str. Pedreira]